MLRVHKIPELLHMLYGDCFGIDAHSRRHNAIGSPSRDVIKHPNAARRRDCSVARTAGHRRTKRRGRSVAIMAENGLGTRQEISFVSAIRRMINKRSKCPWQRTDTTEALFFPKGALPCEPQCGYNRNGAKLAGSNASATHAVFHPSSAPWQGLAKSKGRTS